MSATVTEPGFQTDVPEAEYHADRGSLSVSGAKTILKAPALFKWEQNHPVHKDVFDFGSAAHELVLGIGPGIAVIPATSRAKADQEAHKAAKEAACAEGKTPLTDEDYQTVQAMADTLSSHTLAMRLLSDGKPEVSAYAIDEWTGVMRRGRFDWLGPEGIVDFKTTVNSDPAEFGRTAVNFGYAMQAEWYLRLAADLGHPASYFAFVNQMKTAPYLISVCELDDAALRYGGVRNRRALEIFRDCMASDLWPGWQTDDEFTTVSLPRWAVA